MQERRCVDLASETNQQAETSEPQQRRPELDRGERAALFRRTTCEQQALGQAHRRWKERVTGGACSRLQRAPLSQSLGPRGGVPWRGRSCSSRSTVPGSVCKHGVAMTAADSGKLWDRGVLRRSTIPRGDGLLFRPGRTLSKGTGPCRWGHKTTPGEPRKAAGVTCNRQAEGQGRQSLPALWWTRGHAEGSGGRPSVMRHRPCQSAGVMIMLQDNAGVGKSRSIIMNNTIMNK